MEICVGFGIANHSLNHPYLPDLSPTALEREMRDSRRILQDWFQQPVRGFCYPFGGVNQVVKAAVRAAGHIYARTVNEHESLFPSVDLFEFGVSCRFSDLAFWKRYEHAKADNSVFFFLKSQLRIN